MKNKIHTFITAILLTHFSFAGKPEVKTNRNVSASGFIENKGQITDQNHNPNPAVKYLYHGNGLNVQLKANGFSYDTYTIERKASASNLSSSKDKRVETPDKFQIPNEEIIYHFHRIDVNLIGSNPNSTILNAGASEAYYNYFTTGTPEGGVLNVHSFQQVTYQNIYPHIDLQFICDAEKGFKYNFIVHPGGDYAQIKLQYNGADGIKLQNGEILIPTYNGNVTENIPLSYIQENNEEVKVNYKITNKNEFSFHVNGNYNFLNTLVIDPTPNLDWGTYFGGTGSEQSFSIILDASNNVYIAGYTMGNNGIATSGAFQTTFGGASDVFVAKFNSTGSSLIWGTYYGGTNNDYGNGIAIDASNNVYITGITYSNLSIATGGAYQTNNGGSQDAFLAKFNSTGSSLLWGTYYGGTNNDFGQGIVVDASNNVYITGYTSSGSSIATGGAYQTTFGGGGQDAFLAKFNSTGSSLLWATYYGKTNTDQGNGIVLDSGNNVYITGSSDSFQSIATAGAYQTNFGGGNDAFAAKFNSTGSSLLWATYYGGTGNEYGYGIAIDVGNNIYITGSTTSTSSIATGGAYQTNFSGGNDAFVAKFNSTGSSLIWGTYYGGTNNDYGHGITIDASNNVYITGYTSSTSSIATGGAYQTTLSGFSDALVAKFNPIGSSLLWGTYYGGTSNEIGSGITLDASNNVYFTGYSASTLSIATAGAFQTTNGGGSDAFIAKFIGCANGTPSISVATTNTLLCVGQTATLNASGASTYTFNPGGAGTNIVVSPTITSTYTINGSDANGCTNSTVFTQSVTSCTGINQLGNSFSEINIYPNPFNNKITITASIAKQSVLIYNTLAQIIFSSVIESEKTVIDLSDQSNGIYFVMVMSNNNSTTKKIVKE